MQQGPQNGSINHQRKVGTCLAHFLEQRVDKEVTEAEELGGRLYGPVLHPRRSTPSCHEQRSGLSQLAGLWRLLTLYQKQQQLHVCAVLPAP
jgi:hypothetical protein